VDDIIDQAVEQYLGTRRKLELDEHDEQSILFGEQAVTGNSNNDDDDAHVLFIDEEEHDIFEKWTVSDEMEWNFSFSHACIVASEHKQLS
jgi:hypothetical protein